jgi:hypothetical protein
MEDKEILEESISDLEKSNFDDSLIKDNKSCFVVGDSLYRVRMPSQGEQSLTEHKRNLMQLEYLKQEGCITKTQLLAQLKNSGIVDIEKLDEARENLTKDLKKFWFLLATKDSEDKLKILEYSEQISKIQNNLQKLAIDISTYLNPCLESRLEKFYIEFITSLCTEQRIGEEWKKVWNTFDEFSNNDTTLSNKSIVYMTWLMLNRK